jgi:hypothetical protein
MWRTWNCDAHSKLTYKIGHMFSTFGKIPLLLGYLHSHNCNEYIES